MSVSLSLGRRRAVRALSLTAVAVLAACSSAGGSSGSSESDVGGSTQVRVAYLPTTTALPAMVAKDKGFFADHKLDVKLTLAPNISRLPGTLGRQFDLAMGTQPDLIRAASNGLDVVEASGDTLDTKSNPTVLLITGRDSGITDVSQLAGKTIGSPSLSGNIHAAVLYQLKRKGVDPAKVRTMEASSPNLPDLLRAHRVDAVEALQPWAGQLLQGGAVSLGDPFRAVGDPVTTVFWMAQGSWARSHRDVVERWVAALEDAKGSIKRDPAGARKILRKYTELPAPVAQKIPLPTYSFKIQPGDIEKWVAVLRSVGQFKGSVDPDKLVLSP